jgi:multimeric flavodoxin WrbA
MKKVLGIVGSPRRKGNTHFLVAKILEGAAKEGADTELIFLEGLDIRECDGCHSCWKGNPCIKGDDMNEIYEKIIGSDVLVFGTPVYWYGPTALMKGLIDRLVYFNCPQNRAGIRNKKTILAVPFEEESLETADLLVSFFRRCFSYLEMDLIGKVLVPGVTKRGEIRKKTVVLEEAFELGRRSIREQGCIECE